VAAFLSLNATATTTYSDPLITSVLVLPSTRSKALKPHLESSVDGFELTPSQQGPEPTASTQVVAPPSVTQSDDQTRWLIPHIESSVAGFRTATSEIAIRIESTADGFQAPNIIQGSTDSDSNKIGAKTILEPPITTRLGSPPVVTIKKNTLRPQVVTTVVVGTITLTAGGETATVGQGPGATSIYLDPSGNPVVVIGSSTSTYAIPATIQGQVVTPGGPPITVGSGFHQTTISINAAGKTIAVVEGRTLTLQAATSQVFTVGGITATAIASNYQYLIGSSTLSFGQVLTIDGTKFTLTTDVGGFTILVTDDSTTTLPALAPAQTTSDDTGAQATSVLNNNPGRITHAATPGIISGSRQNAAATSAKNGAAGCMRERWELLIPVLCGLLGAMLGLG